VADYATLLRGRWLYTLYIMRSCIAPMGPIQPGGGGHAQGAGSIGRRVTVPLISHGPEKNFGISMKPPKCRLCGACHWSNEPHVFASNTASNKSQSASNKESRASNTEGVRGGSGGVLRAAAGCAEGGSTGVVGGGSGTGGDKKQRWDRDAYRKYQRDYMRRKRSGFIGIAYG
jgi:hypothetical protein